MNLRKLSAPPLVGNGPARLLECLDETLVLECGPSPGPPQRGGGGSLEDVLNELIVGHERRADVPDAFPERRRSLRAFACSSERTRRVGNVRLEEVSRHVSTIARRDSRGNVETPGLCSGLVA